MKFYAFDPKTDVIVSPDIWVSLVDWNDADYPVSGGYLKMSKGGPPFRFIKEYFNHPDCPFVPVIARFSTVPEIKLKPAEHSLLTNINTFTGWIKQMTDTVPDPADSNLILMKRAKELMKAPESSLENVRKGLNESQRMNYVTIKSELMELEAAGRFNKLTDIERERLVLMRLVEIEGLMQIISDPTTIMNQREAAAYVELTRKFGNEAQRMTEAASATKSEKMSAFKALEDMAKAGYKIEISKDEKRVPIDVDYTQIMDDKIPDPSQK